jgi:small GTP-binding protein
MIWDFGGEERFRFIFPHYISGAKGGILMYDITELSSFSHLSDWLNVVNGSKKKFPILLVGSKSDLENNREISVDEAKEVSRLFGLNSYIECSSKTGENVNKSFELLTKLMINRK